MTHLMEMRERKKKIIAMFMIYMEMLNYFMLMTIVLCYLELSKRSKKRKRSWDFYERSLVREVHFRRIFT